MKNGQLFLPSRRTEGSHASRQQVGLTSANTVPVKAYLFMESIVIYISSASILAVTFSGGSSPL
jgi:hypothetical protein